MKNIFYVLISVTLFACSTQMPSGDAKPTAVADSAVLKNKLIDSLVKAIDDNYGLLHSDYTPSVHKLSEPGMPAVEAVIPLLNSEKKDTRLHAQRVMEGVISRMQGFIPGRGWADKAGEEKAKISLDAIGYNWEDTDLVNREKAIARVKNRMSETK